MTLAKLAGVALSADGGGPSWQLRYGVDPNVQQFVVGRERVDRIWDRAPGPVTLEIGKSKIKQLWILSRGAGVDPWTASVTVADRRWLWSRRLSGRTFNARVRTGDTRFVGEGNFRRIKELKPDISYRQWSLRNGSPWEAEEVLRAVLEDIDPSADLVLPQGGIARTIQIEDLDPDLLGSGTAAIGAVLDFLSGYEIMIDYEGRVVLRDSLDRSEAAEVQKATRRYGLGWAAVEDRRYVRPRKVLVHFDREIELRFDYDQTRDPVSSGTRPRFGREDLILENVMPCPDPTLQITRHGKTREVTYGTWITFDEALDAWSGTEVGLGGRLTAEKIQRLWLAGNALRSLWSITKPPQLIDKTWARRIAAVRRHWRQSFRVLREWRDKLRGLKAYRLAHFDSENATNAPAQAYMDYSVIPTQRGMVIRQRDGGDALTGNVVTGYADNLGSSEASAAPAVVSVSDEDSAVFRVELKEGFLGVEEVMVPGEIDTLPGITASQLLAAQAIQPVMLGQLKILGSWKLAVILTGHQAAPNNLGRFHVEERSPGDATETLGVFVGPSEGPEYHVRIRPSFAMTARYGWRDGDADIIKDAFFDGGNLPDSLLLNRDHIRAIADAAAARIYQLMLDRVEGSVVANQVAGALPTGSLSAVTQMLTPDGMSMTDLSLPHILGPADLMSLLPRSVQRVIAGAVQP